MGQESCLALLKWNAKALEASKPKVQRQVLAIAAEDQSPHFMASNDIQHHVVQSSVTQGLGLLCILRNAPEERLDNNQHELRGQTYLGLISGHLTSLSISSLICKMG